jgi:glycosyltransferase involved in cell wall biosynthesis
MGTRGAIFVLPVTTNGQQGPVAAWMSTAGWAGAGRRVLGASWITTPHGVVDPAGAARRGSAPTLATGEISPWKRRVPTVAKTAVKDFRQWRRARSFRVDRIGPWDGHDVAFVWQRHELFHDAGLDLALTLGVPSVLFVPAPLVWEAREWGVTRPGWTRAVERRGEQRALRRASLVAAGTDRVAEELDRLGVPEHRILVTPTGVDVEAFAPGVAGEPVRDLLGLRDRFVVGWVGSFRRFHALDQAIAAIAGLERTTLLLVGDGPERSRIETLARTAGVDVVCTGTVAHAHLPQYLAAMDVAVVVSAPTQEFHYSPLKLAEYLAAGKPVVAPAVRQIAQRLTDGADAVLVPPGDARALRDALRELRDDDARREGIGRAARATAEREWSWDHQIRRVLDTLDASAHRDRATRC